MKKYFFGMILIGILISSCSVLKTFENLARLKYRIDSTTDYRLQGIRIEHKKSLKDFSAVEMLKLTAGFVKGALPLTFTLNIEAKNPNDGTTGFTQTDITISKFPYRLFLNDKEILQGDIDKPIYVPGKGESIIIPLGIEFDIVKSFKEKSLEDILMLILQVGGASGTTSNIKLKVRPTLGTPIGNIQYPEEITIVDKTFN